ncbi:Suppressor of the cold-sensitive snRNP bioproteinsis mutant brr1-1 [Perkinsus chesapeaki]|uniref:subtilisin n=1 Tax=Perkinsus chesapeaki TaxID=330153 RepID=A0A7J6MLG5_PERCH|nr:Suppressor of the cold-sensitive snRNP bioproteinsis mutant brr1-1 [Perkinsus chesapeaki]
MQAFLPILLIWFAVGQTTRGQRTILSVLSNDSMIDVRHIPQRLSLAGIPTSPKSDKVVAFLSAASIETLKFARCQIVPTSVSTVESDELCEYLHLAGHRMPGLSVACGEDAEVVKLGNRERRDPPTSRSTTTTTPWPMKQRSTTTTTPQPTTLQATITTPTQSITSPARVAPATQPPRPQGDDKLDDPRIHFQTLMRRMKMSDVRQLIKQYPRRNVTIAVIDDGVDFSDPGLAPLRSSFTMSDGRVIDGGWNYVNDSSTLSFDSYHGQFISRIIAAKMTNPYGMAGIASDNVRLLSLQIFEGKKTGSVGNLLKALDMAIDIGVDIISLSMGYRFTADSLGHSRQLMFTMRRAEERGIILVSGAGNDHQNAGRVYPCWFEGSNSICVASLSNDEVYNLSDFSNYGNRVDLAAFGEKMYAGPDGDGSLPLVSGTSFAAPMVTGAAAILLSMGAEPSVVKRLLLEGADHFDSPGRPLNPDGGVLNIFESVKDVIGTYSLRPIDKHTRSLRS